jgi:hypothetical protein
MVIFQKRTICLLLFYGRRTAKFLNNELLIHHVNMSAAQTITVQFSHKGSLKVIVMEVITAKPHNS